MTKQKPQRVLPLLIWGARNPLIRRYFLGVFRFAQMALADVRILTHANNKGYRNKILHVTEGTHADYRDGRDKPAM